MLVKGLRVESGSWAIFYPEAESFVNLIRGYSVEIGQRKEGRLPLLCLGGIDLVRGGPVWEGRKSGKGEWKVKIGPVGSYVSVGNMKEVGELTRKC